MSKVVNVNWEALYHLILATTSFNYWRFLFCLYYSSFELSDLCLTLSIVLETLSLLVMLKLWKCFISNFSVRLNIRRLTNSTPKSLHWPRNAILPAPPLFNLSLTKSSPQLILNVISKPESKRPSRNEISPKRENCRQD